MIKGKGRQIGYQMQRGEGGEKNTSKGIFVGREKFVRRRQGRKLGVINYFFSNSLSFLPPSFSFSLCILSSPPSFLPLSPSPSFSLPLMSLPVFILVLIVIILVGVNLFLAYSTNMTDNFVLFTQTVL
uniref:Transmembrane protein n=1 Tax=Cacopsylla melanoneura TaxID=428564 RepID=A0A8D9B805_9HEMI